jgi:site-specific recombinase
LIEEDERELKSTTGSRLGQTSAQSRVYNLSVRGSVTDAEGFTQAIKQRIEARTRYIELLEGNVEYGEFEVLEDEAADTAAQ